MMAKFFSFLKLRLTMASAAGAFLILSACTAETSTFSRIPAVNEDLSSHFQKQTYALTLQQRGNPQVAVECAYYGNVRRDKGILLTYQSKTKQVTHFERDDCDVGGKIVLQWTDAGPKIHSSRPYAFDVLDTQLKKVVALTNDIKADEGLTKHMLTQPYAKAFKERHLGAIDLACDEGYRDHYRWNMSVEAPYPLPYDGRAIECEFGTVLKIRPTFEGYTVSTNTPISSEDFDKQMLHIEELTQKQHSM